MDLKFKICVALLREHIQIIRMLDFLFHKIGFEKEASIKESYMYDNKPVDVVIYSIETDGKR